MMWTQRRDEGRLGSARGVQGTCASGRLALVAHQWVVVICQSEILLASPSRGMMQGVGNSRYRAQRSLTEEGTRYQPVGKGFWPRLCQLIQRRELTRRPYRSCTLHQEARPRSQTLPGHPALVFSFQFDEGHGSVGCRAGAQRRLGRRVHRGNAVRP